MAVDLSDKIAIVTGAGRGIGKAIALALAEAGATVVPAARTQSELEALAQRIRQHGQAALPVVCDVTKEEDVRRLFERTTAEFGRVDILINNAGIGIYGPIAEFSAEDFDDVMAVNVRGTFLCSKHALRAMMPHKSGYIINISSVVGFKGYPNQAAYTAGKHGVMGFTKSLAVEAQEHDIRVSAVLPGGVDTKMVRRSRPDLDPSVLLQPDDVAQAVLYLLSLSERAAVDQIYIRRRASSPF